MKPGDRKERMTQSIITFLVFLGSGTAFPAISQDAPKPAMDAWLRCLQGNSFSEVEKTPEHAVGIAFDHCRAQEDQAIREQFPEAQASATVEMIRSRVRKGITPSLVSKVVEDRASDPELHAQFAAAVREDERLRTKAAESGASAASIAAGKRCDAFRSTAFTRPNQLAAFARAAANPALATTVAGSLGPFKLDFPKDEFTSTGAYNTERQGRWLTLLAGGQNLIVRKALNPHDLKYDADRSVMVIQVGGPILNPLRRDAEGGYLQIDYKTIREKTQFEGGMYQSVELELPSSAIGTLTHNGSRVFEVPMPPEAARRLKESAVIAFEVSLPITTDPNAAVLYHDIVKFGEKFPDDPRGSIQSRKSFPVQVSCGAIFAGTQFVAPIDGSR